MHTGVPDWAEHTRRADILVAAAGVPGMIQPEHIKPGGVVVGAGVQYEGRKLLPDVDEACEEVAGWITPRVGGVGPTTIALLFRNFVEAAERHAVRMIRELEPLDIPGHEPSGLDGANHPMRVVTRQAAGLAPGEWTPSPRAGRRDLLRRPGRRVGDADDPAAREGRGRRACHGAEAWKVWRSSSGRATAPTPR